MQLSFQFTPDALWSDGTPLSADDVACTVAALQSTPGSAEAELYRSVIEVRQGRIDGVVEVFFDRAEDDFENRRRDHRGSRVLSGAEMSIESENGGESERGFV